MPDRCECRCGYTCFVDGRRTCGLELMACMEAHYVQDCEHVWDGEWVEGDRWGSTTCSRCGMVSMHHDMAVGP